MIDPDLYMQATLIIGRKPDLFPVPWGQHLIMPEVLALLLPYTRVWLPFECAMLAKYLQLAKIKVIRDTMEGFDAVYFGTPTIVNDRPLWFEECEERMSKEDERQRVRAIVAISGGARIVAGLGTGDINLIDRMMDMGPGTRVAAEKHFEGFTDWVLVRP